MRCNQQNCDNDAAFRFTWPGREEEEICEEHEPHLKNIAAAMGMHLQTIPIIREESHNE